VKIKTINDDEKTTLAISGRLDTITAPQLQEVLIPKLGEQKNVELDLSELDYISSAGLRVLLIGEKTATSQGSRQTIVNVMPEVMGVFKLTGFSNVLRFE
jgi:anti-anti-sigma factor